VPDRLGQSGSILKCLRFLCVQLRSGALQDYRATPSMRITGTSQDSRRLPRLLRLSTVAQAYRQTTCPRYALLLRRFAACFRAWPPIRLRGQQRAAGASRAARCEALLRLEGPPRTMRGIPARRQNARRGVGRPDSVCRRGTWEIRWGPHAASAGGTQRGSSSRRRASARRTRRKLLPRCLRRPGPLTTR
jgi:hypothetical protein